MNYNELKDLDYKRKLSRKKALLDLNKRKRALLNACLHCYNYDNLEDCLKYAKARKLLLEKR